MHWGSREQQGQADREEMQLCLLQLERKVKRNAIRAQKAVTVEREPTVFLCPYMKVFLILEDGIVLHEGKNESGYHCYEWGTN